MNCKLPYQLANSLYDWLPSKEGKAAGWVSVSAAEAQKAANAGRPVVVSWKNPSGHGHIAPVRPGELKGGPWLANVGAKNIETVSVSKIFKAAAQKSLRYYANK